MKKLKSRARPDQLEGMARYGMKGEKRLGVAIPDLRNMAKEIGKDHKLALELWKSGILDAMILAAMKELKMSISHEKSKGNLKKRQELDLTYFSVQNMYQK